MGRLLIVVATAPVIVGCNQVSSGPRYQIARVDDGTVVRLDTNTGDIRRFVIVVGGAVAAPSQMRIVHDAASVEGCDELGHRPSREVAREFTAAKGGDTAFYGKSKGGTDEAWAYTCRTVAPSVTQ